VVVDGASWDDGRTAGCFIAPFFRDARERNPAQAHHERNHGNCDWDKTRFGSETRPRNNALFFKQTCNSLIKSIKQQTTTATTK
jgi:hypothetical protein